MMKNLNISPSKVEKYGVNIAKDGIKEMLSKYLVKKTLK